MWFPINHIWMLSRIFSAISLSVLLFKWKKAQRMKNYGNYSIWRGWIGIYSQVFHNANSIKIQEMRTIYKKSEIQTLLKLSFQIVQKIKSFFLYTLLHTRRLHCGLSSCQKPLIKPFPTNSYQTFFYRHIFKRHFI